MAISLQYFFCLQWSLRETSGSWDNWLKELNDYKDQHGNIDVPLKYRHNQGLGAFVNRQRTEYRKLQQGLQSSLTEDRIQDMDDLGFKWSIRVSRTPWETRLDELIQFKERESPRYGNLLPLCLFSLILFSSGILCFGHVI